MSSTDSSVSDFKSSSEKHPETASILSSSTTSSMSAMLKAKFTSKSKGSKSEEKAELTPAQKQAKRREGRVSYQTLATIASLKDKAAKLIEPEPESAADAYQARKATMFLRAGSM